MPTPYAPNWSTVTVRGTYRLGDNTPDSGSVWFTFTDRITDATDDLIFPAGGSFEAKLGANTGSISIDVPCVDDPDIAPNNWSIKVEERLKSGRGATYYIKPTLAMVSTGLNLRTVLVPGSLPAPDAAVRIGVPGGLAVYDRDGDVIDAAGNKVVGGGGGGGGTGGTGAPGPMGPAGPAGPVGQTGAQGPAGIQGVAGPAGQTGPAGPQGTTTWAGITSRPAVILPWTDPNTRNPAAGPGDNVFWLTPTAPNPSLPLAGDQWINTSA